jgi:ABC-2 type transport system permease protein
VSAITTSIAAADRGTWRASLRKYSAITRINLQNGLAYRWDAFGQGLFVVVFVFIFAQLWTTTFSLQKAERIGGLTLNMTIWYFVWAELVTLAKINPTLTIQNEVKDGTLAYTLGRPYNYVLYHFFFGLGNVAVRMVAVVGMGAATALVITGPLASFKPATMPGVLLVTALALVLDYCVLASLGLLAFFFEDTAAFRLIYQKITFVLGGLLLPVDFLPEKIQGVVRVLPFNLVVYAPSKLFVAWDSRQFMQVVALQVGWIVVLAGVLARIYRTGARRVSINGG